jgi:serine/threonine-protein kinase
MAADSQPATAVGSLLNGTYRLERVIAEGGMGVVYEAAHVRLPRRFAVKVLGKPDDSRVSSTALQRFRREAEIASTLAHPHIVEVFDYQISDSGAPYLVMELLEGEDLADRLRRMGRLPMVAALRVIDETAQALDVAHAAGVVHRDLKPANIFLYRRAGRDDFIKVLDFGVSKIIDAATLTHEKAMVGTPLYMSPEQAVGTQELSPASDVFSLGSIAYELLTGRRAFAASSIPSILYQIVHGPTPSLSGRAPGLSAAVDEVFMRVLAKKRDERFQRAGDFAAALQRVVDRQTGQTPVIRVPTTPALDGHWPPEPHEPLDLAVAPDGPSGVFKTGVSGATDIDPSTKAEEAMVAAADAVPPPSLVARHPSLIAKIEEQLPELQSIDVVEMPAPEEPGDRTVQGKALRASKPPSQRTPKPATPEPPPAAVESLVVPQLQPKRNWLWAGAILLPLAVGAGFLWQRSKIPQPSALVAPIEVAPPPPRPAPPVVTIPPAPVLPPVEPVANLEPPHRSTVQFSFHVVPAHAEVRVDGRRVKADKITLPWGDRAHKLQIVAPGFVPLNLATPATESRVFELRMERLPPSHKHVLPSHDAAPVQEL